MKIRRQVHILYDLIKCSKWEKMFKRGTWRSESGLGDLQVDLQDLSKYQHLVVRDCYLTFKELSELDSLQSVLIGMKGML